MRAQVLQDRSAPNCARDNRYRNISLIVSRAGGEDGWSGGQHSYETKSLSLTTRGTTIPGLPKKN